MASDAFGEESVPAKQWRAQGDDLRTFLAELVSILPQAKIPTQIEALIDRDA
jgi:hypothetical protein